MAYRDIIAAASKVVNTILGVPCQYEDRNGLITNEVLISINHNREVKGDFGILAGAYVEASILKSDIEKVRPSDKFTDDEGTLWEITEITKDTSTKWYASIIEKKYWLLIHLRLCLS